MPKKRTIEHFRKIMESSNLSLNVSSEWSAVLLNSCRKQQVTYKLSTSLTKSFKRILAQERNHRGKIHFTRSYDATADTRSLLMRWSAVRSRRTKWSGVINTKRDLYTSSAVAEKQLWRIASVTFFMSLTAESSKESVSAKTCCPVISWGANITPMKLV
jgi:hypothetical protein